MAAVLAVDAAEHGRVGAAAVPGQAAWPPQRIPVPNAADVQQVTVSTAGEYLKPSVSVRGDAGYPDVARLSGSLDPACPVAVAVIIVHEQATSRRIPADARSHLALRRADR